MHKALLDEHGGLEMRLLQLQQEHTADIQGLLGKLTENEVEKTALLQQHMGMLAKQDDVRQVRGSLVGGGPA